MVGLSVLWLSERQVARHQEAEAEANYTTALTAATQYLNILDNGASTGRITFQVKQAILKITEDAFGNLPSENEKPEAAIARVRLLIALESGGNSAVQNGTKAVELARALVKDDPADLERQELLQEALWQLGSRSIVLGKLAEAANFFAEAEQIAEKVVAARPNDETWAGRLNTNRASVAAVMLRRGDLPGALDRFRAINDLIGEGDVLLAEGDVAGAGDVYRQALANATEHEKRIGAHANANTDMVLERAHEKLAEMLRVKGEIEAALKHDTDAVTLGQGLLQNKLGSFFVERVLFAALLGSADIAYAKGDLAGATAQYQSMLAAANERIKAAAAFPEWQSQLGRIDERLGDMALANKDFAGAETHYRDALSIAEKVTAAVGEDAEWRRNVELAHGRLGMALRGKGDGEGAAAEFRTQIRLAEDLVKLAPLDADWQRDLALGLADLGATLADRQDQVGAADAFQRCAAVPIKTAIDPRDELAHDPRDECRAGTVSR
jgi:tetratricopeptide (TPR) repeat protein